MKNSKIQPPPPAHWAGLTNFLFAAFLTAFFSFFPHTNASGQMNKWILAPTLVDFNAQTTLPLAWLSPPVGYTVENTAFGTDGNPLFYIRNKTVFLPSGAVAGNLPNVQGNPLICGGPLYTGIMYEIAIVPVPRTCNRFYIFWCAQTGTCGTALCYTTITVNDDGTLTIGNGTLLGDGFGGSSALAVAKAASPEDDRTLYWVGGGVGLVRYIISASGVSSGSIVIPYTVNNNNNGYEGIEAEVDKSGQKVIWVDKNGKIFYVFVTINGTSDFATQYTGAGSAWGIEFDESEKGFYISTDGNPFLSAGIYHFADLDSPSSSTLVSSSVDYERTFIEKAKDNQFYAVDKNGILGNFTGNGPVSSAFNSLEVFSSVAFNSSLNRHYKLPDQIDGENYDYFYGVSAYDITGTTINGTMLAEQIPPPPPAFYNCNALTLATTWSGQAANWNIQIYSVDPATGNQLFGAPYLNFTTSGTGNVPSPIDLRTIGGNSDLFANYLGQTFAIRITGINECRNSSDFLLCYFRVLGPPAPAMINLQVNPGNGIPCPAAHNIAMPCLTSIFSASLNMGNSSGDVTYYALKIYRVNCTSGNNEALIFDNTATPTQVSGTSQLTAIGLNDLTINGSQGYFVDKCCLCYRIEATIGNPCGSSTDYTFAKFTLPSCNCFAGGGGDDRSSPPDGGIGHTVSPESIRVAPNPSEYQIRFFSTQEGALPEGLSLVVFNALGNVVLQIERPALGAPLSVSKLPAGLYTYRLDTAQGPVSGKFLKQ